MNSLQTIIPYAQIILSVILVALILMQHSDAGAGASFGGGDGFGAGIHQRRGAEKVIFITTIVVAVLFTLSAFAALFIK